MGFWAENDRKRLEALAPARARDDFLAVAPQNLTFGAADLDHLSRLDPRKPGGFLHIKPENLQIKPENLQIKPENLNAKSGSRQNASGYEYTP